MKQKDIIILLVPTFIVIIIWVIFSIYHSSVASTIPQALNIQITPIKPTFDTNTISKLKQRQKVNPVYEMITTGSPAPESSTTNSSPAAQLNIPVSTPLGTTSGGLTQ